MFKLYSKVLLIAFVSAVSSALPMSTTVSTRSPNANVSCGHNFQKQCFSFFSQMMTNSLQMFPDNPDENAMGYAQFKVCTDGEFTMTKGAYVFDVNTNLIASHFHKCNPDDLKMGKDGTNCSGGPVIAWCGTNKNGLIYDSAAGVTYMTECAPVMNHRSTQPNDVVGTFITPSSTGSCDKEKEIYDLVMDLKANYKHYYHNFHSFASWNHWLGANPAKPDPKGMCRGILEMM